MTGIYWGSDEARIKKYGATTTGRKTLVRVEIEVDDHFALGSILSSIERAHAEQEKAATERQPTRASRRKLAAPMLQIAHHRGEDI